MQILLNIIAILFRIFSNSFSNVFQKKLTKSGEAATCINCINYILMSLISIPLLLLVNFSLITPEFWLYAIAGGITGAIGNCFMVLALKQGELSVLGPINSYKAIVGMIFGIFLLHEYPNIYGLLGIGLIIIGSYFILEGPKALLRKDIQYRIYALIFTAIEAVFIKKVIILSSIASSFIISSFLGAIFSYLIMRILENEKLHIPTKKNSIMYISTTLCFAIMTFTTAYVFKYMNVGYALSLFQLSIILNVILGYKLFNEKKLIKKLLGSLIILIGSAAILILGH